MNIKQQLENDLKEAIRNKDELRKRTLRLTLTDIRLAEVEKGGALDEAALLALLQKEIKSRHESIADAERAGRPDLIEEVRAEIGVLEAYLPRQLSPQELEELARQAITETGDLAQRDGAGDEDPHSQTARTGSR
jgi:hypothetical protein